MHKYTDKEGYQWEAVIIDSTHVKLRLIDPILNPSGEFHGFHVYHFQQVADETMNYLKAMGLVEGNFFKIR